MSKTSKDKLPQYVYRTAFGVYRFRRNVPKDIMKVSGRKLWYKVLGKDFQEAMRGYSQSLIEFDSFVASYRRQSPLRETIRSSLLRFPLVLKDAGTMSFASSF